MGSAVTNRDETFARVIDLHGHLLPDAWLSEVQSDPSTYGIEVTRTIADRNGERFRIVSPEAEPFEVFPALWDAEQRMLKLDELHVTSQLIAPPTPALLYDLPRDNSQAVSRLYNETISDIARNSDERLIPAATVPMSWPKVAVSELEYAAEVLDIRLVFIATKIGTTELDDERFEPFFRRASELNIVVQLHPAMFEVDTRLHEHFLHNLIGNPVETAVAVGRLIAGGVLDRIPDLEFVLVHGGGVFPYIAGRMRHGYHHVSSAAASERSPDEYLRRFHYDTLVHDPDVLRCLADMVGPDRLVVGTDTPYLMADDEPLSSLRRAGLDGDERILSGTAASLLQLNLGRNGQPTRKGQPSPPV